MPTIGIKTGYIDISGSTDGQVLTSNGTASYWANSTGGGGGGGGTVVAGVSNAVSEYFTTNGSNTQFTLINPITNSNNSIVSLNGLVLVPIVHYSIVGTTITLTSIPYAGSILEVRNIEGGSGISSGYRGSKGDIGYTGSVGFVGSRGFTGSIGYVGSQGIAGVFAGLGYTGSVGYVGSQGIAGSYAAIGYTGSAPEQTIIIGVSDEITPVLVGSSKVTLMSPFDMTLTQIPRAMLSANSDANVAIDIKQNGTSILGANKLTIDANEQTSVTAATVTSLSTTSISNNAILTVDITAVGSTAKGLKVYLYYVRA